MKKIAMTKRRWAILIILCVILMLVVVAIDNMFICDCGRVHYQVEGPVKQEWVAKYHCNDSSWIEGQVIALDQQDDVYITGKPVTIKYDANGNDLLVVQGKGSSVWGTSLDIQGNFFVVAESVSASYAQVLFMVKYDKSGSEIWSTEITNEVDGNTYMALDNQGNSYITVTDTQSVQIIKHSGINGSELWEITRESSGRRTDYYYIAVDYSGNVYVACLDEVIKYDSAGHELWAVNIDIDVMQGMAGATWLAFDTQGNVCAVTEVHGYWNEGHYYIDKYDADGHLLWQVRYDFNNPPGGNCGLSREVDSYNYGYVYRCGRLRDVAVDSFSNIYVLSGLSVIKYDASGALLWVGGGGEALTVDSTGNVYVTGAKDEWCVTTKYDSEGAEVWNARYWSGLIAHYGTGSEPGDIAVDSSGNVYITGTSIYKICPAWWHMDITEEEYLEYITIKYSQQ